MLRLCLHGLGIELSWPDAALAGSAGRILRPFVVSDLPPQVMPVIGQISHYDAAEVVKHLSSSAVRVPQVDPWLELYQDEERFWLVDERWGISQINFLRGQWRSWILPQPTADPLRIAEGAVLWPLAQLLRGRGLHLAPAIAVARDGWGVLILVPFSIERELVCLLRRGYRIVGQRWTALREEDGRIDLLHMPGVVERVFAPRPRLGLGIRQSHWVDLEREFPKSIQHHAFCDMVLMVEPGRRSAAHASDLSAPEAEQILRYDWPIVDIHPSRRSLSMPQRMAQMCRCATVQLSRNPEDLVVLLDSLRDTSPGHAPQVALFTRAGEARMTIRRR